MTQNYLSHAGKKGMKWGYNDGRRNGKRIADLDGTNGKFGSQDKNKKRNRIDPRLRDHLLWPVGMTNPATRSLIGTARYGIKNRDIIGRRVKRSANSGFNRIGDQMFRTPSSGLVLRESRRIYDLAKKAKKEADIKKKMEKAKKEAEKKHKLFLERRAREKRADEIKKSYDEASNSSKRRAAINARKELKRRSTSKRRAAINKLNEYERKTRRKRIDEINKSYDEASNKSKRRAEANARKELRRRSTSKRMSAADKLKELERETRRKRVNEINKSYDEASNASKRRAAANARKELERRSIKSKRRAAVNDRKELERRARDRRIEEVNKQNSDARKEAKRRSIKRKAASRRRSAK